MAKEAVKQAPLRLRPPFDKAWRANLDALFELRLPKCFRALELRWHLVQARTLEEVGTKLGVSRERVRQIENQAWRSFKRLVRLGFHAAYLQRHKRDLPAASISDLGLCSRTENALRSVRLATIGQAAECSPCQLLAIKNFGRECLRDLRAALGVYGMALRLCEFHGAACGQTPRIRRGRRPAPLRDSHEG